MDRFEVDETPEVQQIIDLSDNREVMAELVACQPYTYFKKIVKRADELGASDIILKSDCSPCLLLNSKVAKLNLEPLTEYQLKMILNIIAGDERQKEFNQTHELDISYEFQGLTRLRVNFYYERGKLASVMRLVPLEIPTIETLGLPKIVQKMVFQKQGMILVTGPTGSGKSTSIAAMINHINANRCCNIITVEDPIEFSHPDIQSLLSQREVGHMLDTASFQVALRQVLRQAPNVIFIGEIRDVETLTVAMQAAETGHLVFSTLHTNTAAETIERIVNMFSGDEQKKVCERLSNTFLGILSQKLVPTKDGKHRVCSVEVLVNTPTISKLVEEGKIHDIYNFMKDDYWKMQTLNQSILSHYEADLITSDMAMAYSPNRGEMMRLIREADRARRPAQTNQAE